jgi:hypothetical protein
VATIVAASGGGVWTVGTTWVGGVAPTQSDDVQLNATSGAVTISATSYCRSLDCTGYTSTLTHAAVNTLNIGDSTAGANTSALRFVAGMVYNLGSVTTSQISFVSTSTTAQTITTAGLTIGAAYFTPASNGSWQFADTFNCGGSIVLSGGILNMNGQTVSSPTFISISGNPRTLTLGSATFTVTASSSTVFNLSTPTNMVITANTGTVIVNGTSAIIDLGGINTNGMSFVMSGDGTAVIRGNGSTMGNLTRTTTATTTCVFSITATSLTLTGRLTCTGNSTSNRLLMQATTVGSPITITAAAVTLNNTDFTDIIAAGVASPFSGTSLGNALGNTNITFTAAVTRYGVVAGNWSSTATWSTSSGGAAGASIPLCHDTVILDANSAAGIYAVDMPRLAKDAVCTGFTRTLQFTTTGNITMYGSITLASGMSLSTNGKGIGFVGRGTHTITSVGKTFGNSLTVSSFGGTYSLNDALADNNGINALLGTFNTNGYTLTSNTAFNFLSPAIVNLSTSTINLNSGGSSFWNATCTLSAASATINVASVVGTSRTFAGGGNNYGTLNYILSGSTGTLAITGANTFGTINFSDASNARTLTLPAGTTTTILKNFNVVGTAGKLMTVNSSTGGTSAIISKATGYVADDYLSIQDSTATGGTKWYAGVNSSSVSNTSGWIFGVAPTNPAGFSSFFD